MPSGDTWEGNTMVLGANMQRNLLHYALSSLKKIISKLSMYFVIAHNCLFYTPAGVLEACKSAVLCFLFNIVYCLPTTLRSHALWHLTKGVQKERPPGARVHPLCKICTVLSRNGLSLKPTEAVYY